MQAGQRPVEGSRCDWSDADSPISHNIHALSLQSKNSQPA